MSTSQSPNKGFWRALGLVIGGLSIGILALALLVTTSGPRVRNVAVQNQTGERISSVSQGLTVVFDRPIVGSDFESAIEFDPEVEYTVSHRQGQLSITFDQNLLSNTEYALTIKPEIEDEAGRPMVASTGTSSLPRNPPLPTWSATTTVGRWTKSSSVLPSPGRARSCTERTGSRVLRATAATWRSWY